MEQARRWAIRRKRLLLLVGAVIAVLAIFLAVLIVVNRLFIHHSLWDWIKLLIVPAILAGGALWFNTQQRAREQQIAERRTQDDILQAYLDGMSHLLTDKERPLHSAQPGDSLSIVARARTTTVLGRLDGSRKRIVVQFLFEAELIYKEHTFLDESGLIERRHSIVQLAQAPLNGVDLSFTYLGGANLDQAYLDGASLRGANLRGADLRGAYLEGADLTFADLSGANLRRANLNDAHLFWANLSGTNLREADLSRALEWEVDQLSEAASLEGTWMPGGQAPKTDRDPELLSSEEWLKRTKKIQEEDE